MGRGGVASSTKFCFLEELKDAEQQSNDDEEERVKEQSEVPPPPSIILHAPINLPKLHNRNGKFPL